MTEENRTDNSVIATERLVKHHAATGAVLPLLDLQRWFADTLKRRPSTTTLAKARKAFQETLKAPDSKTEEMRAFERVFAAAIAPYCERAENAERGEQEALKAADVAVASANQGLLVAEQRFELLLSDAVKKADDADLMRKAAWEATEKALGSLTGQLDAANAELMSVAVRAATVEAERDGALAEAINLRQRLEEALALNSQNGEAHAEELNAERTRSDVREERAGAQMSETTKHWAVQVSALRTELSEMSRKLAASEGALLAQRADHEKALVRARQESINAVSVEIKRLSDALGGVNALFNTHLGSMRSEVELLTAAVLNLVQRIDAKTISFHETLPPKPVDVANKY